MKNNFIITLIQLTCLLLISHSVYSSDVESELKEQEVLDIEYLDEYGSCEDQYDNNNLESNNITSSLLLSGDSFFAPGDLIISSTNARAIVDSYDSSTNKLIYYQTAETGFKSFSLGEKLVGKGENVSIIEEFVLDFGVPCSDLVVSIEESPEQMMFIFADSDEATKAKSAAQEMMAEIETDMARQAALDAFQQKIANEKAAAAKSTAAYQDRLLEEELAAFEAQLEAELASQEMMAEIETDMARQAALDAFQQKIANEKAAAAKSTAAYQDRLLEEELAAFEAQLEAELASQEMMAEIQAEMARQAALDVFLQKLADEKAAAASSTAAYQAKLAYDMRVTKIMDDLIVQLDELGIVDDYKSTIKDELIKEATDKLDDEKFIGTISGEIVTVAIHDFCKVNLGLSDSNIELFRNALKGGYLGNVGPQVTNGTEFSSNRWDDYIDCVGSKRI
jgi:colicin import membrane protein